MLNKCFQVSEWMNESVIHNLSDTEEIKLVDSLHTVKCSKWYLLLPLKTSWEVSHVPKRKNLPSILSTQHKSRMHYLMSFLTEPITFFRVPNNISGTDLCFTILIYQGLMIRSKEKELEGRCQPSIKIRNI